MRGFTRLAPDGVFRTTPEYPGFAWQEAITNAVVHRSYSLSGVRVEVHIFDDRLEVVSPGRLPGIVRVHSIRDMHFSRNPRITRVLADVGLVRDVGEGVDRMFEEMADARLPPPEFQEREHAVRVTLRQASMPDAATSTVTPLSIGKEIHIPANLAQTLTLRQIAALRFLRTCDRITTLDLMHLFPNISDRTASADLMGLVRLQLLHRVGRTVGTYYHSGGIVYKLPNEV